MKNLHWMMMVCCLLPILLSFLVSVFGIRGDVSNVLLIGFLLLCPLMMLTGHKHSAESDEKDTHKKQHGCH